MGIKSEPKVIYAVVEITPAETEEEGELVYYDAERVIMMYDTLKQADALHGFLESIETDFSVFRVQHRFL